VQFAVKFRQCCGEPCKRNERPLIFSDSFWTRTASSGAISKVPETSTLTHQATEPQAPGGTTVPIKSVLAPAALTVIFGCARRGQGAYQYDPSFQICLTTADHQPGKIDVGFRDVGRLNDRDRIATTGRIRRPQSVAHWPAAAVEAAVGLAMAAGPGRPVGPSGRSKLRRFGRSSVGREIGR